MRRAPCAVQRTAMHYIPFNSRNRFHKNRFGALCEGNTVCLRIILPRELRCTGAYLVIHEDSCRDWSYVPMQWESMQGAGEEWWRVEWSAERPGLYWYHFEYDVPFGRSRINNLGNGIGAITSLGEDWQLTVCSRDYQTPQNLRGGIIYQIFPDRFCCSGEEKSGVPDDRILRDDWGGQPYWKPDENGTVRNNDFFRGDLRGIESKLDYIASLGVTHIYLNPIFEAQSNHRYDTADYFKIDPLLGTKEDFVSLCAAAKKRGISLILDGVFSHTGADSVYFNKYGRYGTDGAFRSKKSMYYQWYKFNTWNYDYKCWWGFKTLPEINKENKDFLEFITGKNGVLRYWLRLGAGGWRLDVADELPDVFLDAVRTAVKAEKPQAVIIGEVWEDASNKYSYSKRRRYLLGKQLDSVMNYPFASAVLDFLSTGVVNGFTDKVLTILENYPPQTVHVLMNHIGTHDTVRAITAISGENCEGRDRAWLAELKLTKKKRREGISLMKLASAIQFMLPGVPSIYYGDEAGLEGARDPFNRACYPWGGEEKELLEWYRALGKIRRASPCLIDGEFIPVSEAEGCLAFLRRGRGDGKMLIANRNEHEIVYYLPEELKNSSVILGGERDGAYGVRIPAFGAAILKIN